jgi:glutamate synthase (NADPH/NADH) small chain
MVLIAAGFVGPEADGLIEEGLVNSRGNIVVNEKWLVDDNDDQAPLFGCGDAVRGQSLIVWAIAEGRSAAAAVDAALRGHSDLPQPVRPGQLSWGT